MGNKKPTENPETKPENVEAASMYVDGKEAVTKVGMNGKLYLVTNDLKDSPDLYVIAASQNSAITTVAAEMHGYQAKIMTKSDKLAAVLS